MNVEDYESVVIDDSFERLFQNFLFNTFTVEKLSRKQVVAYRYVCHTFFMELNDWLDEGQDESDVLRIYRDSKDFLNRLWEKKLSEMEGTIQ